MHAGIQAKTYMSAYDPQDSHKVNTRSLLNAVQGSGRAWTGAKEYKILSFTKSKKAQYLCLHACTMMIAYTELGQQSKGFSRCSREFSFKYI